MSTNSVGIVQNVERGEGSEREWEDGEEEDEDEEDGGVARGYQSGNAVMRCVHTIYYASTSSPTQ